MTKKEFVKLYESKKISEICEIIGCSQSTIYRLLQQYNLPLKQGRISIKRRPKKFDLE